MCAWPGAQGEAIAVNLREMFGFQVPILSVVIGEGGSGGALAIGCANHNLIMEHSVYYVASPEACAAILWKSRDKAATVRWPCLFNPLGFRVIYIVIIIIWVSCCETGMWGGWPRALHLWDAARCAVRSRRMEFWLSVVSPFTSSCPSCCSGFLAHGVCWQACVLREAFRLLGNGGRRHRLVQMGLL